jgi:predicted secreted protein
MQITVAQNNQTVKVAVNDTFDVVLTENPSTGYTWALEPEDSKSVSFVNTAYVPSSPGTIGAGGMRTWTFKAAAPGTTAINFVKAAPNGTPVKDFSVSIVV